METLYFNELSIDPSCSRLPVNKADAIVLLRKFIRSVLSYAVATGEKDVAMVTANQKGLWGSLQLYHNGTIGALIKELREEENSEFTYEQIKRFQTIVSESFAPHWEPEYEYHRHSAIGLGEAFQNEAFAISLETQSCHVQNDWKLNSMISIEKIPAVGANSIVQVKHIATVLHVFDTHQLWRNCIYVNSRPSMSIFPNSQLSHLALEVIGLMSWSQFYAPTFQNVSACNQFAKIVARINGYDDKGKMKDNQGTPRDTYCANNYYLQVDTQHKAFECYQGKRTHQGEIPFNSNQINRTKQSNTRFIR